MKLERGPFNLMQAKIKDIEIRLYDEKRRKISIGDTITFCELYNEKQNFDRDVSGLLIFPTFEKLFSNIDLLRTGSSSQEIVQTAVASMWHFYSAEQEKEYGVLGLVLE